MKKALCGEFAKDRTIILVTHHISLCLPIAEHLVELSAGAVIRNGSTKELRERGELEKIVEAEDTTEEDGTETSSETEVENEADLSKANGNGNGNGNGMGKLVDCKAGKLVEEETRAEGRVSMRTYWTYMKAAGVGCWIWTFASMLLIRFINISVQVGFFENMPRCDLFMGCRFSWQNGAKHTSTATLAMREPSTYKLSGTTFRLQTKTSNHG